MATKSSDVFLRSVTLEDLTRLVEIGFHLGIRYLGIHKLRALVASHPQGWIVAEHRPTNKAIGFAFVYTFDEVSAASIGFVVVDKNYQGQQIGSTIIDASIKHAQNVQTIQLYASDQGFPVYQRRGFVTVNKRLVKYIILVTDDVKKKMVVNNFPNVKLKSFEAGNLASLIKYDSKIHTASRADFLTAYLQPSKVTTLVAWKDEDIHGYGCVEKMHWEQYLLGPLYAKSPEVAEALFYSLIAHVPNNNKVFFYTPTYDEENITMERLAATYGAEFRPFPVMVKGKDLNICLDDVYCIADGNVGLV